MNITIIYFSQTGNTQKVTDVLVEVLLEKGHDVKAIPMKKATPDDIGAADILGIGTPCFSSQAPTPVKEFLKELPVLDSRRAFVFATSGGAPGRVLYDLTRLLKDKGAAVIGGFLTRGKLSHPAPCLVGRMPDRPNENDLTEVRRFASALAEHLSHNGAGTVVGSRPDAFTPGFGFYNLVGMMSSDGFLRLVLPKPKVDTSRCNQCGWCETECPVDNVTLEPYPVLGKKCIRCYRCLTGCPNNAFTADWRFGNVAVWSLYNTAFERWFGDLKPSEKIY